MAIPKTIEGREYRKFVDSPRGDGFNSVEVTVANTPDNPIPVDPTSRGITRTEYNEVQSVAQGEIVIIDKTVGVGLLYDLQSVFCSGDNIAYFIVEINGQTKYKGRTYWSGFNLSFNLSDEGIVEGDNIKIIADNKTNMSAFFNATLKYNEVNNA